MAESSDDKDTNRIFCGVIALWSVFNPGVSLDVRDYEHYRRGVEAVLDTIERYDREDSVQRRVDEAAELARNDGTAYPRYDRKDAADG